MQVTESEISKSCFAFPHIQCNRSRLIAKIGHLIDQLAINIGSKRRASSGDLHIVFLSVLNGIKPG